MRLNCFFLALLALPACATDEAATIAVPEDDPKVGAEEQRLCFTRAINGFSDWNDGQGIVLTRGVNDRYLVTFAGPCPEARNALTVGLGRNVGGGCLEAGDRIFLSDRLPGSSPRTIDTFSTGFCMVNRIFVYDRKEPEEAEEAGAE